jgi:heme A synthase
VSRRSRFVAFGSAGLLVVIGALGAALVSGTTGQVVALVLIGGGLMLATALVFLEVGLSEDRERARAERQRTREQRERDRAERQRSPDRSAPSRPSGASPRLGRSRGHRRRLGP